MFWNQCSDKKKQIKIYSDSQKRNYKTKVTCVTDIYVPPVTTWAQTHFPSREKLRLDERLEVHAPSLSVRGTEWLYRAWICFKAVLQNIYNSKNELWVQCGKNGAQQTQLTVFKPHFRTKTELCLSFGLRTELLFQQSLRILIYNRRHTWNGESTKKNYNRPYISKRHSIKKYQKKS